MARIGMLPWWTGFPLSVGAWLMAAFAPSYLPEWVQNSLFVLGAALFLWGLAAAAVHFFRDAGRDRGQTKLAAYSSHAEHAFKTIGGAIGENTSLGYEMAITTIEPMFLLLRGAGIPIPRLRGDGVKLGVLRAHRYLNLLHGPLQIGDNREAKRRAVKAVPLINSVSEDRLWRDIKPTSRKVIAAPLQYNNSATAGLPRYDDEHRGPAVTDAYELSACRIDLMEHSETWPLPDNLPPGMVEFAEGIPEDQRADWLRRLAAQEEVDRLISYAMRSGDLPIWVAPIGEPEHQVAPSAMLEVDRATIASGCYRPPNDGGWLKGRPLFVMRNDWAQFVDEVQRSKGVPPRPRGT